MKHCVSFGQQQHAVEQFEDCVAWLVDGENDGSVMTRKSENKT